MNEKTFQVDRKHALQTLLVAIKVETGSDHCDSAQNSVPATSLVNTSHPIRHAIRAFDVQSQIRAVDTRG